MVFPKSWPTRRLFDIRIDAVSLADVLTAVDSSIASRHRLLIGVVNAAKLVNMREDAGLRRAVLGADMILADGMSVVWACALMRNRLPERVAGIDLMTRILDRCHARGYRVYCLGATKVVLAEVRARIASGYPGAELVGCRDGYFDAAEEEAVAREIAAAKADVLLVAMSSPRKETFLAHWAASMDVPVCHGVGGAFDVFAGKVKRAPALWQRLGMEWLYRAVQEPKRLGRRYLVTNVVFGAMVAGEMFRRIGRRIAGALPSLRSAWGAERA